MKNDFKRIRKYGLSANIHTKIHFNMFFFLYTINNKEFFLLLW